jgi:hypothetical protein
VVADGAGVEERWLIAGIVVHTETRAGIRARSFAQCEGRLVVSPARAPLLQSAVIVEVGTPRSCAASAIGAGELVELGGALLDVGDGADDDGPAVSDVGAEVVVDGVVGDVDAGVVGADGAGVSVGVLGVLDAGADPAADPAAGLGDAGEVDVVGPGAVACWLTWVTDAVPVTTAAGTVTVVTDGAGSGGRCPLS